MKHMSMQRKRRVCLLMLSEACYCEIVTFKPCQENSIASENTAATVQHENTPGGHPPSTYLSSRTVVQLHTSETEGCENAQRLKETQSSIRIARKAPSISQIKCCSLHIQSPSHHCGCFRTQCLALNIK